MTSTDAGDGTGGGADVVADHVVVGAGSAGCAMAYRLAEAGRTVAVVEAGGSDRSPYIQMPGALSYPMNMPRYDWGYRTEPEPNLGGRRLAAPRGRVLGGSSSINGMVYVRGHPMDYDHWAEAGARGWGFADVVPYFRRMEAATGGDDAWRGRDGPVHVRPGPMTNPLARAFVEAGTQAGLGRTDDYNGARQEGFAAMEATIRDGRRWSAADAYLRPARATGRVALVRGEAARVLLEAGRATGVVLTDGRHVAARADVILCASAFNTPKLLMLSGIGPDAHLAAHGIPVVVDRAGVGANLQDHLEILVQQSSRLPVSLARYWNTWGKAYVGARWLARRSGPGASNQFEACAFLRSRPDVPYPDLQYHFLPIALRYDGAWSADGHGFQAHVGPQRSRSRGTVRLRAPAPEAPPVIRFDYMAHPEDWADFRRCIRLTRRIFAQPAFAPFAGAEIFPGPDAQDDAALDAAVRDHVESAYHPCGTARMGDPADPMAVVDPHGRVIGVDGLRVADSSVFPRIPNGNLNAPAIMVGEKMADHVLGRALPRSNLVPWRGEVAEAAR